LSSILLGMLVRDYDDISSNFSSLFYSCDFHFACEWMGKVITLVLIGAFIRNIHGSVCYENMVSRTKVRSCLEETCLGRCLTFFFSLFVLFGGPFFAGYCMTHHAIAISRSATGVSQRVVISGTVLTLVLFMPLAIYLLWDMLLWVARPEESDLGLDKTVNNWSKIDALTMIALLVVGCFQLVRTSHGYSFNFEFLAVAFVVIMTGVIVSDYYLNRHFYFPDELDRGKSV
jgi:hypothetical protein